MYGDGDLFEVFEDRPKGDRSKSRKSRVEPGDRLKKRNANGNGRPQNDDELEATDAMALDSGPAAVENGVTALPEKPPLAKRQRRESGGAPIATDSFQIESVREVPASGGLTSQDTEGKSIIIPHQVRHQVSLPTDYDYKPIEHHKFLDPPARAYGFTLDPFQKTSVAAIERGESVLVSAHTSAGKTVVAEYAIAQSLRDNQRVIYTSPIKALSNQKYREFSAEFGDVGLMTGDTTINPSATCLVMTTEILRSMLYRGSEVMREVQWVIFDEIHYMRDKCRGVVWEETIILLPDKVRYVFLSATIPNAMQFAEWICKTHNQPCHVVYTDFRPTPLQNYLFPAGADGIHLVVDEKGVFREDNFQKAMASIAENQGDDPGNFDGRKGKGPNKWKTSTGGNKGPSDIYKIVRMIMIKNYNPVIVFCFSKRECEKLALQMSQLAFNDEAEKNMVGKVFENAISSLSEENRGLNQIQHALPLLRRGIGIHHSGLLPILKEVIEILFQEGLIKVLFATETFSIGLNMPAKTVVFTNVRKFDGKSMRWVTPSEFVQMSGRAGRRGLDDRGIVILMLNETMEPAVAREILKGEQDRLNSAFHLGYNMILNLMRVEGISPEYMLEKCFSQFQNTASASGLEKELGELENERINISMDDEDEATVRQYYDLRQQLDKHTKDMREVINNPTYCLQFMQPGRVVKVKYLNHDFGWGAVVNYSKRMRSKSGEEFPPQESYVVDVLLNLASDAQSYTKPGFDLPIGVKPPGEGDKGKMEVVPVLLSCLASISGVRIFLPKDMKSQEQRNIARKNIEEVKRRFVDGIPVLDPIENMGITDENFKKLLQASLLQPSHQKMESLESRLLRNPLHNSHRLKGLYSLYNHKVELTERIKAVKKKIALAYSVIQLDELKRRKRVLRRLGFISETDVIQLKARVACEISSGDELLLSELLFNRVFNELNTEQTAALLSCFVFEERSDSTFRLPNELDKPFKELQAEARHIARVTADSRLTIDEEEYVQRFKPHVMEVVYSWAKGSSFATISRMTDIYEGALIRMFRRLEELLRQLAMAAKVMGNEDLEKKFEDALGKTRRDIVNSGSLYL